MVCWLLLKVPDCEFYISQLVLCRHILSSENYIGRGKSNYMQIESYLNVSTLRILVSFFKDKIESRRQFSTSVTPSFLCKEITLAIFLYLEKHLTQKIYLKDSNACQNMYKFFII